MTDKRQAILTEIPRLRRFAHALVGDGAAADDLVQDCLERALGRLHLWREKTNMRAWLFTILRNLHVNQRRHAARRPRETSFDERLEHSKGTAPAQGRELAMGDLGRALDMLPQKRREVVLLIGLEEMSYQETARILGVPVGTVMSRLSRGRATLQSLLEDPGQGKGPQLRRIK